MECDGRGGFYLCARFRLKIGVGGPWSDSGWILFDSGAESVGKLGLVVDKGCWWGIWVCWGGWFEVFGMWSGGVLEEK